MGIVRCHISVSLDGYAAGPNQGTEHPLGEGGDQLHEWAYNLDRWLQAHGKEGGETNASSAVMDEAIAGVGAGVMGRNMFGGGPGPWPEDPSWDGWWGEDPPFHVPVFVLTHHEREPLEMAGGTTFHFVTDGVESAVAKAQRRRGRPGRHCRGRRRHHQPDPARRSPGRAGAPRHPGDPGRGRAVAG